MSEEEKFEKQKRTIHILGTLAKVFLPLGIALVCVLVTLGITFNCLATFAFPKESALATLFFHLANGCNGLIGSFALPCLIGGIVLRAIWNKKREANPLSQDSQNEADVH